MKKEPQLTANDQIDLAAAVDEEERRLEGLPDWKNLPNGRTKTVSLRQLAERNVSDQMLIMQEAQKDARPIDPILVSTRLNEVCRAQTCRAFFDVERFSRDIEWQLRCERVLAELLEPTSEPTEDELVQFFRTRRDLFHLPYAIEVAQIFKCVDDGCSEKDARANIQFALVALENGIPFRLVAETYSDCKGNGGDLGFVVRGMMVEEFDNAVFGVPVPGRTAIFRTPFGYHIAEVRSAVPARRMEFVEAKATINAFLTRALEQEALTSAMAKLRRRTDTDRKCAP